MRINTNLTAMNTYAQYTKNQNKISGAVAKLSSGYAINSAADNAAGLAISEKMRAQIRGLDKASSNAQDAISLVQTAEGALDSSTQILQRMREIAVQSSSDTNQDLDRNALQDEFKQLQSELNDISKNTTFNKKNLLDGSLGATSKSVTKVALGNNSLAVSVGSATAGDYNFKVSVRQENAAVDGSKPTDFSATMGSTAAGYFKAVGAATANLTTGQTSKVILGEKASASDLLNGNYSLSATSNSDGSLSVKATGDNGQTFTATVTSKQLSDLQTSSGTPNGGELTLTFNADSKDAFTLAMGVKDFSNTENGVTTLSNAIRDTTVSVSGGVTSQAATYGVYGSITGGESVKLNTGDTSATFSNGITVSFNKLTASDLDTTAVTDTSKYTALSSTNAMSTTAANFTIGGDTTRTVSSLKATVSDPDGVLASGAYSIKTDTDGYLVLEDANHVTYSNSATTTINVANGATSGSTSAITLTNANGDDITVTFSATLDAAAGSATTVDLNDSITFSTGTTTNAGPYSGAAVTGGTMSLSNLKASDSSTLQEGKVTFNASATDADGYVTFTAEDSKGNTYTAKALASNLVQARDTTAAPLTAGTATTKSLKFTSDTDGNTAFTVDLTTQATDISAAAVAFAGATADEMTVSVDNIGHNYSKVFGDGKTGALTENGASSFSVEESANAGLTFQVGANEGDEMTLNIEKMDSETLGVNSAKVDTREAATAAVSVVDKAINQVSAQRASLGAVQNRLTYKIDNLSTSSTNLTAAESQIRDVDMAKEMTEFTNANILSQAATAMLAQANSLPQSVLSLIGK